MLLSVWKSIEGSVDVLVMGGEREACLDWVDDRKLC